MGYKVGQSGIERGGVILLILLSLLLILEGVWVRGQTDISVEGGEYAALQTQIHKLDTENAVLKEKLYQIESLSYIEEEARRMGFVDRGTK